MTKKSLIPVIECYMKQVYDHDSEEVYIGKYGMDYAKWSPDTNQIIVVDDSAEVFTMTELSGILRGKIFQSLANSMCCDVSYTFQLPVNE